MLLSHRLYYCPTDYITVSQIILLSHKLYYCPADYITVPQTTLLSHRLYYCPTDYITVLQTILLSHRLYYCPTDYITVLHTILLSHILYYCPTNYITVLQTILLSYRLYYCPTGDITVPMPSLACTCTVALNIHSSHPLRNTWCRIPSAEGRACADSPIVINFASGEFRATPDLTGLKTIIYIAKLISVHVSIISLL